MPGMEGGGAEERALPVKKPTCKKLDRKRALSSSPPRLACKKNSSVKKPVCGGVGIVCILCCGEFVVVWRDNDTVPLVYLPAYWLSGIKPRCIYMYTFFICFCYSMQEKAVNSLTYCILLLFFPWNKYMCEAIEQVLIVDRGRCQFNVILKLSRDFTYIFYVLCPDKCIYFYICV